MVFTLILLGIENSDRDPRFVSRFLFFLYSCQCCNLLALHDLQEAERRLSEHEKYGCMAIMPLILYRLRSLQVFWRSCAVCTVGSSTVNGVHRAESVLEDVWRDPSPAGEGLYEAKEAPSQNRSRNYKVSWDTQRRSGSCGWIIAWKPVSLPAQSNP